MSIAAGLRVWIHAELECGPAKVRKRVSFRGAACRMLGRCGMRTFCGPEENTNQDFDVGPDPDTQEEDLPPLGWTPDPEGRP